MGAAFGFLLFFFAVLLMMLTSGSAAAASPSLAKPSCPESNWQCGNVSNIPYPFGIGKDCYKDKSFEIRCNQNVAILSSVKMEILSISLDSGVVVKAPTLSFGCPGRKDGRFLNFTGTPFMASPWEDVFIAAGGNFDATLTGIGSALVGCKVPWGNHGNQTTTSGGGVCSGDHCCMAPNLPGGIQFVNVSFKPQDTGEFMGNGSEGCKVGFLVDYRWFADEGIDFADEGIDYNWPDPVPTNSQEVKNLKYVPMVLNWVVKRVDVDNNTVSCDSNPGTDEFLRCSCVEGFEGNPYLGCQDFDECNDPNPIRPHSCGVLTKCVNERGTYSCELHGLRIAILVVGLVGGVLILLIAIWFLYKEVRKRKSINLKKKYFKRNGGLLLQTKIYSSTDGSIQKTKIFTSRELEKATDGFSENRVLGRGGQGIVYKGMLVNGSIVAIKKSKIVDEGQLEEFINEVVILSHIHHRNVVSLLGCCLETQVPLLVYEFIPNGTLYHHLHDPKEQLSWEMRIRIATEAAEAIAYLHSAASIPIYHRDIKSTNILLDEKYRAKVSDFGTSRSIEIDQTHLTTRVHGTFGYLDPEYFQSGQFTEKSDVYSFGVVLVELLSGQKPVFQSESSHEIKSLATDFISMVGEKEILDILDDQIKLEDCHDEVIAVARLAKRCLKVNGRFRPTMKEVATELQRIWASRKADLSGKEMNQVEG